MEIDQEKMVFNVRAKASMQQYLRSKTWVEKIRSMERMREADKLMKAGMREAMAKESNAKRQASDLQQSNTTPSTSD